MKKLDYCEICKQKLKYLNYSENTRGYRQLTCNHTIRDFRKKFGDRWYHCRKCGASSWTGIDDNR